MGRALITGIDIGHHSIKAVVVRLAGEQYELVSYKEFPLAEEIFADNHTLDHQSIVKKLKELKKSLPRFCKKVALSVPDNAVISKVLQIDSELDDKEKEFAIYQVFGQQSPFPVEELSLDYVKIDNDSSMRTTETYQVYATRKEVIESRIEALKKSGFLPLVVDAQAHALLRIWDLASLEHQDKHSWLLVDVGLTQTSVCIVPKDRPAYFKDFPFGTQNISINKMESSPFRLDPNMDLIDETSSCDVIDNPIDDGADLFINELGERLGRQINLYGSVNQSQPVEGVWLTGGGANISGLAEALCGQLSLPVAVLNPFGLLTGNALKGHKEDFELSAFSTATGLAIRGLQWHRGKHVA